MRVCVRVCVCAQVCVRVCVCKGVCVTEYELSQAGRAVQRFSKVFPRLIAR